MSDQLKEVFHDGAFEYLDELEKSLLKLGENPSNPECISSIFRVMHTIKGSASMVGFTDVSSFAHQIETEYEAVRQGQTEVTQELISVTLEAKDQISLLIEAYYGGDAADPAVSERILAKIREGKKRTLQKNPNQGYFEKAVGHLANLDHLLKALAENPEDAALIGKTFWNFQNLKRMAQTLFLDSVMEFMEDLMRVYSAAQNRTVLLNRDLVQVTITARDELERMFEEANPQNPPGEINPDDVLASLERPLAIKAAFKEKAAALEKGTPSMETIAGVEQSFKIRVPFSADMIEAGMTPGSIMEKLKTLGPCSILQMPQGQIPSDLDLIQKTMNSQKAIQNMIAAILPPGMFTVELLDELSMSPEDQVQKVGQILVEQGAVQPEALARALQEQKPIGEKLVEAGVVDREKVNAALAEQKRQKDSAAAKQRAKVEPSTSIRVSSQKLDKLVNLIGELVTVQERLSQAASIFREIPKEILPAALSTFDVNIISEEVSRLTNGLRDNALSIRMLPIEATFSKFKRLVYDLSSSLGKEIELTTKGSETEIDKTVIDKLDEPLMHLIRNCADHGIEMPDVRERNGKPRKGTIHLAAEHSGGNVLIHVWDDGGGLRKESILKKALEKKLIPPNAELTDKEIYNLIFLPGFSTAEKITNVSGRGVGMDVVKQTIDDLRGHVDVTSTPGVGTKVDVTLPLTLAIIDGLLVTIAEQPFILPLSAVEECIELKWEENRLNDGQRVINVRGSLTPYIHLRERFNLVGSRPKIEQIVISRFRGQRIGFAVDAVIGEHKTVIKPLGRYYRHIQEFSGASILGDGSVAIILDIGKMLQSESRERTV